MHLKAFVIFFLLKFRTNSSFSVISCIVTSATLAPWGQTQIAVHTSFSDRAFLGILTTFTKSRLLVYQYHLWVSPQAPMVAGLFFVFFPLLLLLIVFIQNFWNGAVLQLKFWFAKTINYKILIKPVIFHVY